MAEGGAGAGGAGYCGRDPPRAAHSWVRTLTRTIELMVSYHGGLVDSLSS